MKRLIFEDLYSWSVFSPERQVDFNGHLWVRPDGNILIDPVAMSDADQEHLTALGGVRSIVLTNADHEREAAALREQMGADVIVHEADADALSITPTRTFGTERRLSLVYMPSISVTEKSRRNRTLLPREGGRSLRRSGRRRPDGSIDLLADEKLADPPKAALELRKILGLRFNTILVGDGHSIFKDARHTSLTASKRDGTSISTASILMKSRGSIKMHRILMILRTRTLIRSLAARIWGIVLSVSYPVR